MIVTLKRVDGLRSIQERNLLFTRLGAASVWSLNARKARMFGAEVFFWIIFQMRIGNILNVLHELRQKETGLSFFLRFETLRQISSSNSFRFSIEVEGFHPAALGQVHRYPRCEGLLVSSWLWRAVSWVLVRCGRSHGGLKQHFGWIFLNCKIPRRQWNLQVLVTFRWPSYQYCKYSFQWNELHFRLRAFKFGVASPHCLDTGTSSLIFPVRKVIIWQNLLLNLPASYASFGHTWKRSWNIYFKVTVLVILCSDSKLSNYEWEKSKLSSLILPNIQLNVSGSIIF